MANGAALHYLTSQYLAQKMMVRYYLTGHGNSVMTVSNCRPPHAVVLYPFGGLDPSYRRAYSRHSIRGHLKNVMVVFVRLTALSRWSNSVGISKDVISRFSCSPRTTKIAAGRYRSLWLDTLRAWYGRRQEGEQWGEENHTENNDAVHILVSDVRTEAQSVLRSISVQSTSIRNTIYAHVWNSRIPDTISKTPGLEKHSFQL